MECRRVQRRHWMAGRSRSIVRSGRVWDLGPGEAADLGRPGQAWFSYTSWHWLCQLRMLARACSVCFRQRAPNAPALDRFLRQLLILLPFGDKLTTVPSGKAMKRKGTHGFTFVE